MPLRILMLHPETGETVSASEKAAEALIEKGYELADDETPALGDMKREQLDKIAADAGVEDPEKLPNKAAVIEAIEHAKGGE